MPMFAFIGIGTPTVSSTAPHPYYGYSGPGYAVGTKEGDSLSTNTHQHPVLDAAESDGCLPNAVIDENLPTLAGVSPRL